MRGKGKKSNHERIEEACKDARVIPVRRSYLDLLQNDMNAAILLAQLVYWSDRTSRKDGTFYKSIAELEEETTLSPYKLDKAKDKLINAGYISVSVQRANGSPVNHWRLHLDNLINDLSCITTTKKLSSHYQETKECTTKKLENPLPSNLGVHYQETRESITKKLGNHEHKITTKSTTEDYNRDHAKMGARDFDFDLTGFDELWSAYPNKAAMGRAEAAWIALDPDKELQATMLEAVEKQRSSPQWDEPRYIPHLANWINDKRWEDEIDDGRYREPDDSEYGGDVARIMAMIRGETDDGE